MKTKTTPLLEYFAVRCFFGFLLTLNAGLTFRTGSLYLSELFNVVPGAGAIIGGAMLLVLLDGAAIFWAIGKRRQKVSSEQIAIATGMVWASLIASLLVSIIAVLSSSSLVDVSSISDSLQLIALTTILLAITANALAMYLYNQLDPRAIGRAITAQSAAMVQEARAKKLMQLKAKVAELVEKELEKEQAELARKEVEEIRKAYAEEMGKL